MGSCPKRVSRALKNVTGVTSVEVSYFDKNAIVQAGEPLCNSLGVKDLIKGIEKEGYTGIFLKISPPKKAKKKTKKKT